MAAVTLGGVVFVLGIFYAALLSYFQILLVFGIKSKKNVSVRFAF